MGVFAEIASGRDSSGYSLNPLKYSEIEAYNRLFKKGFQMWEIMALKRLDLIYLNLQSENQKKQIKKA